MIIHSAVMAAESQKDTVCTSMGACTAPGWVDFLKTRPGTQGAGFVENAPADCSAPASDGYRKKCYRKSMFNAVAVASMSVLSSTHILTNLKVYVVILISYRH